MEGYQDGSSRNMKGEHEMASSGSGEEEVCVMSSHEHSSEPQSSTKYRRFINSLTASSSRRTLFRTFTQYGTHHPPQGMSITAVSSYSIYCNLLMTIQTNFDTH
jgi:hypothetical protein